MEDLTIQIDKIDRRILAELDKNCRIPISVLARKVRKSRQAVEYRVNQLVKNKIILSFDTSINPAKLGYRIYKIYLQLRNIPEEREKLLDFLKKCGKVYWFGECDGQWDLIFGVFSKSDFEFYTLKNKILLNFNKIIVKNNSTILLDAKQYSKSYFNDQPSEPVLFGGEVKFFELKDLDKKLLFNLINNARTPLTELSKKVDSTPIIVKNRIKKLEKEGIILQYRISVNLEKLGFEFFKAIINIEKQDELVERKLSYFVSQSKNTQYFIRNLWDFEIELVVKDYSEYNKIINEIKKEFPDVIRNVETVIMKSDVWTPSFIF
jgi:Lrp/AsnC family leucine-responsive transcriptional regulator